MPIDVVVETHIARPRALVAGVAGDPAHDTTWIRNIREVEWLTAPPVAVGTEIARVAHFLGKRLAYTYRVDAWEPGRRLAMRSVDGPFPMTTDYTWDDDGDGTRMRIRVGGGPEGGFFGLATPVLALQVRGALAKDLRLLKALMERGDFDG